jgi:hypothetical protein
MEIRREGRGSVRGKIRLVALLLCVLLLGACASPVPAGTYENLRALQEARRQYRNSSLVVRGKCVETHIDTKGLACYDLEITEVIAGEADTGDVIHSGKAMDTGGEYLLYLSEGEDALYAEDTAGYTLEAGPLPVKDGSVLWDGTNIGYSELMRDIGEMSSVIVAPAKTYYYNKLEDLVKASDEIFIGRVTQMPRLREIPFRTRDEGVSTESSPLASVVTVQAFGSVKGSTRYGDTVELVYSREMAANLLYADTLAALTERYPVSLLREGDLYVFFLNRGPDAKQSYMFPVNVYQGSVRLSGDTLYAPNSNSALEGYDSLVPLVRDMRKALE